MKCKAIFMSAALLALGVGGAMADATSDSRVTKLEETVRQLEQRVAALEGQSRDTAKSASVPTELVNWRKLQNGMAMADVERLLGSPTKVDAHISFTTWYYGESRTGGQVEFNTKSQTVEGWDEP